MKYTFFCSVLFCSDQLCFLSTVDKKDIPTVSIQRMCNVKVWNLFCITFKPLLILQNNGCIVNIDCLMSCYSNYVFLYYKVCNVMCMNIVFCLIDLEHY